MPQLPSGRHVSIDVHPLSAWVDRWPEEQACETITSLRSVGDMAPFVRVLEMVPDESTSPSDISIATGSNVPPPGLGLHDGGRRLSDWPAAFEDWSVEDRAAFQTFIDERGMPHLQRVLDEVKAQQAQRTKEFLGVLEGEWRKHGIHPDQEPGWTDLPDTFKLDVYDQIVALGQCQAALSAMPPAMERTNAMDRLEGFWSFACRSLIGLPLAFDPVQSTAALAQELRQCSGGRLFPPERRDWWMEQLAIECRCRFDSAALESFLVQHAPKAYGVIRTVLVMSPKRGRN